jgi:hypothetical protein
MMFRRLLKLTIVDALDHVWSEAGITPSKKTRQAIIRAAEMISNEIQQDFVNADKEALLKNEKWGSALPAPGRRVAQPSDVAALDELVSII